MASSSAFEAIFFWDKKDQQRAATGGRSVTALYSVRVTLSRESCLSLSALQQPFNVHTVLLGETRYLVMLERHRGFNVINREAAGSGNVLDALAHRAFELAPVRDLIAFWSGAFGLK
jgi:hypothetical protein